MLAAAFGRASGGQPIIGFTRQSNQHHSQYEIIGKPQQPAPDGNAGDADAVLCDGARECPRLPADKLHSSRYLECRCQGYSRRGAFRDSESAGNDYWIQFQYNGKPAYIYSGLVSSARPAASPTRRPTSTKRPPATPTLMPTAADTDIPTATDTPTSNPYTNIDRPADSRRRSWGDYVCDDPR